MKKLFVCVVVLIALSLSVVASAEVASDSPFVNVFAEFPQGEEMNWNETRRLVMRYKDDKTLIPMSYYYRGTMCATIPRENADREVEAFLADAVKFTDNVNYDYVFSDMEALACLGVIKGDEQGRANPYSEITRAEAAAMILRYIGIEEDSDAKILFEDISDDSWYRGVVGAASKWGIVNGDTPYVFSPERSVSKEEFVTMLARSLWRVNDFYDKEQFTEYTEDFDDAKMISDWARDAYEYFGSNGMYKHEESEELDADGFAKYVRKAYPKDNALRHEAADLIENARTLFTIYPSKEAIEFGFDKEMPIIDGSTSTYPFTEAVYRNLFSNGYRHRDIPKSHSKSHASYQRLINGEVDMIFASVYPATDILELAEEKGVELELIPIAYDAMIFFTNADNPATNLTKEQITDIYVNNKYNNWSQIGGTDALLYPYCRNNDSGSHAQMEKHFLKGKDIHPEVKKETSMAMSDILTDVMDAKTDNPVGYGLGYSIYYYFHNMNMFYGTNTHLKLLAIDGVQPTDETIADGSYPLSNNTYVVLRKDSPKDSLERKMAEFMLTPKGQDCVQEAGFGPLKK